ncbi:aspartyl-phosphate phosphatase Spo0E family protein [Bacillus solitudinis]|uniref:aspartyl-phosphate phosphatase Spo0E family protein n=1 Tax=Bacillus solitudinis TaxID=2014074 RepID=UPI000C2370E3
MSSKSVTQLLQEIEANRQTLNELANSKGLHSEDIIIQSQKLDKLLNRYSTIAN